MKKKSRSTGAAPKDPAAEGQVESPRRTLPAFGFAADLLRPQTTPEAQPVAGASSRLVQEPDATDLVGLEVELGQDDPLVSSFEVEGALSGPGRVFDFADRLSARSDEKKSTGPKPRLETCLTFGLGGETFAMPVEPVQQVVRISQITRVPHAPKPIRGVTNLRGKVIPVIDLRVRVGLPAAIVERTSRIVAVSSRGRVIGLLVDSVHQVMHLDLNQIQRPPEDVMTVQSDYIAGVYHHGSQLLLVLDVDRALIIREAGVA